MPDFSTLLQQGAGNAWLFVPSAILLGALHGLEPGHSKTMMAAFIVAIRGTVAQAALLGIAATASHTAVVWAVAMAGLYYGQNWNAGSGETYLQLASGALIVAVAAWMFWRTWRQQRTCFHAHGDGHGHHHHDDVRNIDTGHGTLRLQLFENGTPPRFRIHRDSARGHGWPVDQVHMETERSDGSRQAFTFAERDDFLESEQVVAEPHEFVARLSLGHDDHRHDFDLEFVEHHHHAILDYEGLDVTAPGYQDPHELAHANDIRHRFASREVTTGQIIVFGLTGGLIPCPASITVLLICLQLKQFALGTTLVLGFSVGLALTMVASGTLAALSVKHVSRKWSGFGELARKAPYFSSALILLVGLYIGGQAATALA